MKRLAVRGPRWTKHPKTTSPPTRTITTSHNDPAPLEKRPRYLLTLHTDAEHQKHLTAPRIHYTVRPFRDFPLRMALFRNLPPSQLAVIDADIAALAEQQRSFPIVKGNAYLLDRRASIDVDTLRAQGMYDRLKEKWGGFLSKQDQSFKAGYTLQKKRHYVPEKALVKLERTFRKFRGRFDGLSLYRFDRYYKGRWRHVKDFMFPRRKGRSAHKQGLKTKTAMTGPTQSQQQKKQQQRSRQILSVYRAPIKSFTAPKPIPQPKRQCLPTPIPSHANRRRSPEESSTSRSQAGAP